ncbi:hypothetical protein C0416_01520 [bacterium]|nr:hypothetical protein [bacterium]
MPLALKILILILGASTVAIPATARDRKVPAGIAASTISAVLKNVDTDSDDIDCMELLPDGTVRMVMTGDEPSPCRLGYASGLMLRLDKGYFVTSETEGILTQGLLRAYTSGIPYRIIGDSRHLVEPNATADIVVEENFTHVLSKEGETSVIACEMSEDPACIKRGFLLLEGDMITLQRDGQVYAWENSQGDDLSLKEQGGCSTGKGRTSSPWIMMALFWTLMWLRRRKPRDS